MAPVCDPCMRVEASRAERRGTSEVTTRGECGLSAAMNSGLEQPVLERVAHEVGAGREAELALDVRAVCLDRPHAEEELLADLGIGVPEGDQAQDLDLPRAEVVRHLGGG